MVISAIISVYLQTRRGKNKNRNINIKLEGIDNLLEKRISANNREETFQFLDKLLYSLSKILGNIQIERKDIIFAILRKTDDSPEGKIHFIMDDSIITAPLTNESTQFCNPDYRIKYIGNYLSHTNEPL